jgi:hypothetical protein
MPALRATQSAAAGRVALESNSHWTKAFDLIDGVPHDPLDESHVKAMRTLFDGCQTGKLRCGAGQLNWVLE